MQNKVLLGSGIAILLAVIVYFFVFKDTQAQDLYPQERAKLMQAAQQRYDNANSLANADNSAVEIDQLLASSSGRVQTLLGEVASSDLDSLHNDIAELKISPDEFQEMLKWNRIGVSDIIQNNVKLQSLLLELSEKKHYRAIVNKSFKHSYLNAIPNLAKMRYLFCFMALCANNHWLNYNDVHQAGAVFLNTLRLADQFTCQNIAQVSVTSTVYAELALHGFLNFLPSEQLTKAEYEAYLKTLNSCHYSPELFVSYMNDLFASYMVEGELVALGEISHGTHYEPKDDNGKPLELAKKAYRNRVKAMMLCLSNDYLGHYALFTGLNQPSSKDAVMKELNKTVHVDREHCEDCISQLLFAADRYRTVLTDLGAAKILCALQLYKLEHQQLPQSLSQLTPKYLPTLPLNYLKASGEFDYAIKDGMLNLSIKNDKGEGKTFSPIDKVYKQQILSRQ